MIDYLDYSLEQAVAAYSYFESVVPAEEEETEESAPAPVSASTIASLVKERKSLAERQSQNESPRKASNESPRRSRSAAKTRLPKSLNESPKRSRSAEKPRLYAQVPEGAGVSLDKPTSELASGIPAPSGTSGAAEEATPFEGFSAPPNSFGLCVGKSASKDLMKVIGVFEPLCAETPEGESLRKEGFELADPNGNGLCSLAELEGYMQKKLQAAYPKKKDEPDIAADLYSAFRPCYIRAFTDAKDYKADLGETIKGTKNATDDDFVSVEEFRLFNVYICVYAAMFDAFAKIGESKPAAPFKDPP